MTRRPTIVVNKNTPMAVEVFSRIGDVVGLDTREVTADAVRDADILVVRSETKVDRSLLNGSRVRFVGTVTIGTDHVDTEYLASKDVAFASAPGSNANSVAEYLASVLLTWSVRTGEPLTGKTIGIVGVGNVGKKVVRVAQALGMQVLLNDPPLARSTGGTAFRPLDELMGADFITLHVPLTKTGPDPTYHFFNAERIAAMKPGAVLINTSRGLVVESRALKDALSSRHLSCAILDVWEGEPEIDTSLLDLTILGTPHIAGYSLDGKLNALSMVYNEVCRYLGIKNRQGIDAVEMLPEESKITIPGTITDTAEVVRSAVRRAYDIEMDDSLLRGIKSLPAGGRAKYFMDLRANYRIRREFFNRVVELLPTQVSAKPVLDNLGFNTVVLEAVR